MTLGGLQRRLQRGSRRAGWAWLLALVLLQAQWLGQWHGVAHAGGGAVPAQAVERDAHADFGHAADDEAQCRLYDAVGSAAGPCAVPALAPVQVLDVVPRNAVPPLRAGRPDRRYEARAPPQG